MQTVHQLQCSVMGSPVEWQIGYAEKYFHYNAYLTITLIE